jgi:transposase
MTFQVLLSQAQELATEKAVLQSEVKRLRERHVDHEAYIARLEEAVLLLRRRAFAPSSEKISDDQLVFDEIETLAAQNPNPEEDDTEEPSQDSEKKKRPKRKKFPKDLPREIVTIDIPEEEKKCPHDGTDLEVVSEEVSERLDIIPMQVKVIETHRLTYGCRCCSSHMQTAPVEASIIPKGIPTAGTLAFIATSKFVDGMSLYHIEEILKRHGVEVPRTTMASWMIRSHESLQAIINLLEDGFFESGYGQIDETTLQVLKEEGKKPQTLSYMWVRASPGSDKPVVLFDYDPSRRAEVAKRLTQDFKGKLQCDGFSAYDVLEGNRDIIRYGCMAHLRRKFYEATKATNGANVAKHALRLIKKLYRIEDDIRGKPPDHIKAVRQEKSIPVLAELLKLADENLHRVPPKSPTGKALTYLKNEWPYLSRYAEDGEVHIDNNFVENKIRPFAIGRKRWLFSDTVDGAKASAALYSIVETAKANKLDPYKYLRHLFGKLPLAKELADFEALLPWNVKI